MRFFRYGAAGKGEYTKLTADELISVASIIAGGHTQTTARQCYGGVKPNAEDCTVTDGPGKTPDASKHEEDLLPYQEVFT